MLKCKQRQPLDGDSDKAWASRLVQWTIWDGFMFTHITCHAESWYICGSNDNVISFPSREEEWGFHRHYHRQPIACMHVGKRRDNLLRLHAPSKGMDSRQQMSGTIVTETVMQVSIHEPCHTQ